MKKALPLSVVVMLMIILIPGANLASATPGVQQQVPPPCPTYNEGNLIVDYINSVPHSAVVGDTIITTFHVIYADGTPVTLEPRTAGFNWTGPSGSKEFDEVPVVPNGTAGFYNYTQQFTQDIIQATGSGTITIAIVFCSCQDGLGNRGPTTNISSIQTPTPVDNSQISPTTPTQPVPVTTYVAPILIVVLLILALLMLFLRRRRKPT